MNTRTELANLLRSALPASWWVLDAARSFDEPPASVPAIVAVQRMSIAPAPELGGYREDFNVWLIEPSHDVDFIDDNLDDHLELVHDALQQIPFLLWNRSTRDTYNEDSYHAYRAEITVGTQKKESP